MRKNFPLRHPRKADARVLDAIKHDIRNYVVRERRKPLPEGAAFWEFACKVGATPETAKSVALKEISAALDAVGATGVDHVHVEITAVAAVRTTPAPRTRPPAASSGR